jgi:integral membrane protein (TIGR00529 family)
MLALVKILAVFLVIIVGNRLFKSLPLAVLAASTAAALFFQLAPLDALITVGKSLVSKMTLTTLFSFYCITFLQRMMETRGLLDSAEEALNGIFNNHRVNASLAPVFIGMMPSPGAVTISGSIVDKAAGSSLSAEEKAFVASFYRHIPEAILPTYSTIIIGAQLSGQSVGAFLVLTFPMVLMLAALGYAFYLRKIPKETGKPASLDKGKEWIRLFQSFWTILATIILIIALKLPVYAAAGVAIILNALFSRFSWGEIRTIIRTAWEWKLMLATVSIMIFKDVVIETGALLTLPDVLSRLPVPDYVVFFLLFFFGAIVSGQSSINVIGIPLAFASIPHAGAPLLVYLMSAGYVAMQMSPTHICLAIVTEYFHVDMGALLRKTAPLLLVYCVILTGYYLLLATLI